MHLLPACIMVKNKQILITRVSKNPMLIRHWLSMVTDGKNCSVSVCAATSGKILGLLQELQGFIMFMVHAGLSTEAVKKHLQLSAGTVSYTHLRAHETVLDLVCR